MKTQEEIENPANVSELNSIQLSDFIKKHPELLESYSSLKRKIEINGTIAFDQSEIILDENEKRMLLLFNEDLKAKIDCLNAKIDDLTEKIEVNDSIIRQKRARIQELKNEIDNAEEKIKNTERKILHAFMIKYLLMSIISSLFIVSYMYIQNYYYKIEFSNFDFLTFIIGAFSIIFILTFKDFKVIIGIITKTVLKNKDRDRSH